MDISCHLPFRSWLQVWPHHRQDPVRAEHGPGALPQPLAIQNQPFPGPRKVRTVDAFSIPFQWAILVCPVAASGDMESWWVVGSPNWGELLLKLRGRCFFFTVFLSRPNRQHFVVNCNEFCISIFKDFVVLWFYIRHCNSIHARFALPVWHTFYHDIRTAWNPFDMHTVLSVFGESDRGISLNLLARLSFLYPCTVGHVSFLFCTVCVCHVSF